MRKCVLIINLYTIRRKCHMIAESAQPRNPSNVTRPFLARWVGSGTETIELLACMVLHVVRTLTSSRVL